jgi:hypothetical protein
VCPSHHPRRWDSEISGQRDGTERASWRR